jgi:hypothetical protein
MNIKSKVKLLSMLSKDRLSQICGLERAVTQRRVRGRQGDPGKKDADRQTKIVVLVTERLDLRVVYEEELK